MDFSQGGANLSPDHPKLFTFVYELEELLKQSRVRSKYISFALPTDPVFINIIPVDAALQGNEVSAHIQWELEQYHPDTPLKEFIIDSQPLPWGDKDVKQMFVVCVRRGMVGFLKKAVAELKLQLHLVDIDHFSTEKSLRFNYPECAEENVALFGVRHGRVDASLVLQGELCDYRAFLIDSSADVGDAVATYLTYLKEKEGVDSPGKIVLHGMDITPALVAKIKRERGTETLALDAVRGLSPSKKPHEPFVKESSRFAAAIGLALRASP